MKSIAEINIGKFRDLQGQDKKLSAILRFQFFCHYFILEAYKCIFMTDNLLTLKCIVCLKHKWFTPFRGK